MSLQNFYFLPLKIKFQMFRKKELKNLILDEFFIVYGNVFIYYKEAFKYVIRNNYEFLRCNNKFCKLYRKQIGLWKHSIFLSTKI